MTYSDDACPVARNRVLINLDARARRLPRGRIATVFDFVAKATSDLEGDSTFVVLVHLHPDILQRHSSGMVNYNAVCTSVHISDHNIFQTRSGPLDANCG